MAFPILLGVTTAVPTYGNTITIPPVASTFSYEATVTGTGAVSATVVIYASNDATNWLTLGTITLSGTTTASDGFVSNAQWAYIRAGVTAISGTGATVNCQMNFGVMK